MKEIKERYPIVVGPNGPTFRNEAELMSFVPSHYSYDSSAGSRSEGTWAELILSDGSKIPVRGDDEEESGYAYTPTVKTEGESIRAAIARQDRPVVAVIIHQESQCSWEDDDPEFEGPFSVAIPLKPLDWGKIRRRLEDRLRKDPKAVRECVALLDIPIY